MAKTKGKKVMIESFNRSKEKFLNEIPLDPQSFFIELGYSETSWRTQKTRLSNILGLTLGQTLTPRDIYLILEKVGSSGSKNKNKANAWMKLFKEIPEEERCGTIEDFQDLDLPSELLKKYDVSIENVSEKHRLIKKITTTRYIYELNKKIYMYRFGYDIRVCELLKEAYKLKLLDDIVFDERTLTDEYIPPIKKRSSEYKYRAESKNGINLFNNISIFADDNGLSVASIKKCLQGTQKTHKGWSFTKIEEEFHEDRRGGAIMNIKKCENNLKIGYFKEYEDLPDYIKEKAIKDSICLDQLCGSMIFYKHKKEDNEIIVTETVKLLIKDILQLDYASIDMITSYPKIESNRVYKKEFLLWLVDQGIHYYKGTFLIIENNEVDGVLNPKIIKYIRSYYDQFVAK